MYVEAYLAEIEARLGPILGEQGLETVLDDSDSYYYVFFQRTDENGLIWRSPVSFCITSPEESGRTEPDWSVETIALNKGSSRVFSVGTNGWVQYDGRWSGDGYWTAEGADFNDWDETFEAAAHGLMTYPLVPEEEDVPGILSEGNMYVFWPLLRDSCSQRGIDDVEVHRNAKGHEYFQFEYMGSTFEVVWNLTHRAQLIHDEKRYASVDILDYAAMQEAVEKQLDLAAGHAPG
jgi:hypothetical protein